MERISMSRRFTVCALVAGLAAAYAVPSVAQDLSLERISTGYSDSVFATFAPGDNTHLYIVEQHTGRIEVLDLTNPGAGPSLFLDVDAAAGVPSVSQFNEQGLLGLAFAPDYQTSGDLYVYTTRGSGSGATFVDQYNRLGGAGSLVGDPNSRDTILTYNQPQTNHNGGWLGFGPDGYLYIASGDGGNGNDTGTGHTAGIGNAQDITNNLLGAMLRIDPDGNGGYNIPDDNPFVGVTGDDEIWAYGLRNPWRPSFDRDTGDLIIADVGQNAREEINFQHADSAGGENYGWRLREGTIQTPAAGIGGPRPAGAIDPFHEYTHGFGTNQGLSITGGYVYRGPITQARGEYYFADYVSNNIWTLEIDRETGEMVAGSLTRVNGELPTDVGSVNNISSFAEDADGNLYFITLSGSIFRLTTDRILGDMDDSFAVNLGDVALFGEAITMSESAFDAANPTADYDAGDTNQDGLVNDEDALLMLEFLRGSHVDDNVISRFFDAVNPGDLTEDGTVGVEDLDLVLMNWEQGVTAGDHTRGDTNNDGIINQADLAIIQANWGDTLPGFDGVVPEPSTLATFGILGLLLRRRRR